MIVFLVRLADTAQRPVQHATLLHTVAYGHHVRTPKLMELDQCLVSVFTAPRLVRSRPPFGV